MQAELKGYRHKVTLLPTHEQQTQSIAICILEMKAVLTYTKTNRSLYTN